MKRPPKKVTMEEARKAHHIRWVMLSQGTSGENGMITLILDMWTDGSGLNFSRFFGIIDFWSTASLQANNQLSRDSGALGSFSQRPLMPQRLTHVWSSTFRSSPAHMASLQESWLKRMHARDIKKKNQLIFKKKKSSYWSCASRCAFAIGIARHQLDVYVKITFCATSSKGVIIIQMPADKTRNIIKIITPK